ncbi:glycosyltransferase family 2 protein [Spongiimicrobium sp. 3-5]|uniref:glycosyltransferase family 2 protein n=1 Tax=Spongiimicrobium sp. 3-5 TaxID=3332596 RepID=UPI003980A90C
MNCLLSIIIPTKNRYNTLLPLLDYLISIKSNQLEIVIQDNSDDNNSILKFLNANPDRKLSYFHTNKKLSQTGNSDLAVKNSQGEYVCFIGDDDGVMPYIVDIVQWMKNEGVDVVKGHKPHYSWPGLQISYLEEDVSGVLRYKKWNNKVRSIDCKKELNNTLSKGGTTLTMLPCLYHGIVSRAVLDRIYAKTNSYFPGPSPDMANAIALCFYVDNYKFLDFPVVVSGKSSSSIGGQGVLHKHIARIEDVAHLPSSTKNNWSTKIPKYWTGPTIWAESTIKSLEACGRSSKMNRMDFSHLYAELFVFEFKYRKQIFKNFGHSIYSASFFINLVKIFIKRTFTFILNKTKVKINSRNGVKDIGQAIAILEKEVDKNYLFFLNKDKSV